MLLVGISAISLFEIKILQKSLEGTKRICLFIKRHLTLINKKWLIMS